MSPGQQHHRPWGRTGGRGLTLGAEVAMETLGTLALVPPATLSAIQTGLAAATCRHDTTHVGARTQQDEPAASRYLIDFLRET